MKKLEFTLRPWKKEDLEFVAKNATDKEITGNMSDAFPDSVDKWAKFLEYAIGNEDILYLAIDINGEAAGEIGVKPMAMFTSKMLKWDIGLQKNTGDRELLRWLSHLIAFLYLIFKT